MKESIVRRRREVKRAIENIDHCTKALRELKGEKYQCELDLAHTVVELHRFRNELQDAEDVLAALNAEPREK